MRFTVQVIGFTVLQFVLYKKLDYMESKCKLLLMQKKFQLHYASDILVYHISTFSGIIRARNSSPSTIFWTKLAQHSKTEIIYRSWGNLHWQVSNLIFMNWCLQFSNNESRVNNQRGPFVTHRWPWRPVGLLIFKPLTC